jgi:hypothetical protein
MDPLSDETATMSPLTEKWNSAIQAEFDAIDQHQMVGDFVELPEGRNALRSHWVYKIKCNGAANGQRYRSRLVCGRNH